MSADDRFVHSERFAHIEGRVGRLEGDLKDIEVALDGRIERFAHIESGVKRLEDEVKDIEITLNGPPRSESVRGRLHQLETSEAAAQAAEAALGMARVLHDRRLTKWERVAAIGFGAVMASSSLLTTALVVAAHS